MNLAEKIKSRRNELNMSQEELAKKMGYSSRSSINKIENGRPVSQKIIYRLAKVLETTPAYLMGWEEEETKKDSKDSNKIRWLNEVGETKFNDDEMTQLINFAKYLISQRGNKQ